jgi:hypothetical protein
MHEIRFGASGEILPVTITQNGENATGRQSIL